MVGLCKIMKEFFERNKTFVAIIISALIVGGAIYFSGNKNLSVDKNSTGNKIIKSGKLSYSTNCSNIPELKDGVLKLVTKIIDGDTFLIEGGYSVRILGIDADERDHPCYDAAKNRLEELILNKEVKLEKGSEDKDQWCRYLRYVILDDKNIGLELVKEGLAVARFSPEDVKYRQEILQAEKYAKENKIGCKWSSFTKTTTDLNEKTEFQWKKLTSELTGLKVVGACQAGNYYGNEVIVEGKIAGTYRSKTNTVFLNFEKPYPNQCFTAVIFSSDQYKFVEFPEKYYADKIVRVRGVVKEYKGKPEIILKSPEQIEIGK